MDIDPTEFCAVVEPGRHARLTAAGDLDLAGFDKFILAIAELFTTPPETVTLDLEGVTFLDSVGIRGLVTLFTRCDAAGAKLVTVNAPDQVRRVLELTNLTDQLHIR